MARTFLSSGQTQGIAPGSEATELFGTNGNETVNVLAGADVIFDASFNRGGDVINIAGNAASYTATIVGGSRIVLTGTNGSEIDIPVGGVGVTINFADAAGRVLKFDDSGALLLGSQTINTVGDTGVAAGDGGDGGEQPQPADAIYLTPYADRGGDYNGTSGNDTFIALREGAANGSGNVVNTLQSGDIIRGGSGTDTLHAVLGYEAGNALGVIYDVQPTLNSIERIEIEARDSSFVIGGGSSYYGSQAVYFDAKDVSGHVRIGSQQSDGDLVIENLTTLNSNGVARNTDEITITMDHTDNFNSDGDASDLFVFFDDDYLLAGQSRTVSQANYWLLDEDSPDYVNEPLLNIERNGVSLTIDGTPVSIEITTNIPDIPDTWEGYAAALQARIDQMIAAGTTILQGITVQVDWNNTDSTYNDFGNQVTIPAITLIDSNGRSLVPTGYLIPEGASGSFDIFGRFDNVPSEALDNPIAVNIELNKVGRAGDGGDLIVGGKAGDKGIEVFHVSVVGGSDKPSSLGTLASTGNALAEVYITTDPANVNGSHASLEIRDGFGDHLQSYDDPAWPGVNGGGSAGSYNIYPNDLRLVDADGFLGDLALGTDHRIVNLDTLTAQGGGDVVFRGELDGTETNQPYSYTTGAGDDYVDLLIDGDALDFAQSSVYVSTGDGNDEVVISTDVRWEENVNQAVLRNIEVNTGAGDDIVTLNVGTRGTTVINTGSGNDVIYTDGGDTEEEGGNDYAAWAFNFDNANPPTDTEDLQGVQTSLRYIGNATLNVTLSGAGVGDNADGGGVMSQGDALRWVNGYEVEVPIGQLINGNKYFGDQRDINAALVKAINEDAVLNKLLVAEVTENNTVVVRSLTSGVFDADDLEVVLIQKTNPSDTNLQYANDVLAEARAVTHNSSLTLADVWGAQAPAANATYVGPLSIADTAWYAGIGTDSAHQLSTGLASNSETDNIINGGTGNDVIVLSTDAVDGFSGPAFTNSSHNALLNGASNETIVLGDSLTAHAFGNDKVMNFETANFVPGQGDEPASLNAGLDFLDFGFFLTSTQDLSVNGPNNPDNDVSNSLIPVTLELNTVVNPVVDAAANEVIIIRFDPTATNSWAGLGNAQIQNLFNNSTAANDFGNFVAANFGALDEYTADVANGTDQLLGGANSAKAVLMVENADNLGEYKVFELSWNGNDTADADPSAPNNGVVTAILQGSLDFGTSLDAGIHEVNFVGSQSYNDLIATGLSNYNYNTVV